MPPALVLLRSPFFWVHVLVIVLLAGCRIADRAGGELEPLQASALAVLPDTLQARFLLSEAGDWLLEAKYDSVWPRIVRAKQLYAASPHPAGELQAALLEGRYHLDQGRFNDTYALVDSALSIAIPILGEHHRLIADGHDILGNSSRIRGDLDAVERHFFAALRIREALYGPESPRVAESHHNIGLYYHVRGELDVAKKHYEIRLALEDELSRIDSLGVARTYNNLGSVYSGLGNLEASMSNYEHALAIRLDVLPPVHADIAATLHNLGNLYVSLRDFRKALTHFQKAIDIRVLLFGNRHVDIAGGYYSMARVYRTLEENDLAVEYFDQAYASLDHEQYVRHPLLQLILSQKSSALMKLGQFELAEASLHEAGKLVRDQYGLDHRHMITVGIAQGILNEERGQLVRADSIFAHTYGLSHQIYGPRHTQTAGVLLNQASIKKKRGRYAEAERLFERGIDILKIEDRERRLIAQAYNDSGELAQLYGDGVEVALQRYQQALISNVKGFAEENWLINPDPGMLDVYSEDRLFDTLVLKAGALNTLYDRDRKERYLLAAFDTYRQAGELVHVYLHELSTEASKLAWVGRTHSLYEPAIATALRLYRSTGDVAYREAAFAFAEQSRGRVLASSITAARARQYASLPDSLLEREENIRLRLTYYTRSLKEVEQTSAADSARVALWKGKVFALKREYDALIARFESSYPAYYILKHQSSTTSLTEVQATLHGTEDTLVEYFVGADSLYAFAVTAASVDIAVTAIDSSMAGEVEALRTAIVGHDAARFAESAHGLYRQLVAPVASSIRGTHVTIVPDAFLSQIPFETLLTAPAASAAPAYVDWPYLLESHSISYAYSSTLFADRRSDRPAAARDFVAYAPVFVDGLAAGTRGAALVAENGFPPGEALNRGFLPATFDEVKSIEKLFAASRGWFASLFGGKTRLFLEEQATEASIREALRDYRFVHLATHAFVNENDPLLSGIVLLDDTTGGHDGVLELAEIYNLDLNAELVTLSACQTGLGRQIRGEGLLGLTRGFLFAGARNVLVSLWNVQDQATARLMTDFYGGVLAGLPKGQALRDAKRKLMASSDHLADPFFWSPFVLNGR